MSGDEKCQAHGRSVCSDCCNIPDSARRAYDVIRSYTAFVGYDERVRSWVALRLEDGGSDGTLYGSKQDAIKHQAHEHLCAYFSYRGAPDGFSSVKDAAVWLEFHRHAYSQGFRLADPDDRAGGPELIMPTTQEQVMGQLRSLLPGVN